MLLCVTAFCLPPKLSARLDLFFSPAWHRVDWETKKCERILNQHRKFVQGDYADFQNYFSINWNNNGNLSTAKKLESLRLKLINHVSSGSSRLTMRWIAYLAIKPKNMNPSSLGITGLCVCCHAR